MKLNNAFCLLTPTAHKTMLKLFRVYTVYLRYVFFALNAVKTRAAKP